MINSNLMSHKKLCEMFEMSPELNCGDCYACCKNQDIWIREDMGDDLNLYETEIKEGKPIIKLGLDGNCMYLVQGKCSIYDNRPIVCSGFDCRFLFRTMDKEDVKDFYTQSGMGGAYEAGYTRMVKEFGEPK